MCTRSIATLPLARIPATLLTLVLIATWSPAGAQQAAADDRPEPAAPVRPAIVIDAERSFYDLRSGGVRFEENVSITRGPMDVQADQGFVRQSNGQITEVELQGTPATWRDQLEDGSIVTGQAGTIFFDVIANVVTLTGNAIIRHEQGEFTGDELVYDLTAESLAGRSTGTERVRVVIEPEAMSPPQPRDEPSSAPPSSDDDLSAGNPPADAGTATTDPASEPTTEDASIVDENSTAQEPPADDSNSVETDETDAEAADEPVEDPPAGSSEPDGR